MKYKFLLIIVCIFYRQSLAADILPNDADVKSAILSSPQINAAVARQNSLSSRADAIASGPAEFTVKGSSQRRNVSDITSANYKEHSIALERPIRYWGKWRADSSLSDATKSFAKIEYSDALHETSRDLLSNWFSYLKAYQTRVVSERNINLGNRLSKITQTRYRVGEISKLDAQLVDAEKSRLNAIGEIAKAQENSSASLMKTRYPMINLDVNINIADIPIYLGSQDVVRQHYVEKSHELNMMKLDAERFKLNAKRVSLDRIPDPTIGIYNSRERGGAEVINGISISIPIPSGARFSNADAAYSDAEFARQRVILTEQKVSSEFDNLWQQVISRRLAAEALKDSAKNQNEAAIKAEKAYVLGEGTISDLIMARKTANETQLYADMMTLDALEAYYRLKLDMHEMWDFD